MPGKLSLSLLTLALWQAPCAFAFRPSVLSTQSLGSLASLQALRSRAPQSPGGLSLSLKALGDTQAPDSAGSGPAATQILDPLDPISVTRSLPETLYKSLNLELEDYELEMQGSCPSWLRGCLVRNGPALYEYGDETVEHWLDGAAMLHSFSFDNGAVRYTNKLIDSINMRRHRAEGRIAVRETISGPNRNIFERLKALIEFQENYQNTAVSVAKLGGHYVALTDLPTAMTFEPDTVKTLGPLEFVDDLPRGLMSTAHPLPSKDGKTMYGFTTNAGVGILQEEYVLWKVKEEQHSGGRRVERELVARIPAETGAAYMHSFGVTDKYAVLAEFPLRVSVPKLLASEMQRWFLGKQDFTLFEWREGAGSDFIVVNLESGEIEGRFHTPEDMWSYHHINCFEKDGKIHVDMTVLEKEPMFDGQHVHLQMLREGSEVFIDTNFGCEIRRYSLDLTSSEEQRTNGEAVSKQVLYDTMCEVPVINEKFRSDPSYRFAYGTGPAAKSQKYWKPVLKVDTATGQAIKWYQEACAPEEPTFVPNPNAESEDDGVILTVVLDGMTKKTFLLGLEAKTMTEKFRAQLPHHIPHGIHGQFFPSDPKP